MIHFTYSRKTTDKSFTSHFQLVDTFEFLLCYIGVGNWLWCGIQQSVVDPDCCVQVLLTAVLPAPDSKCKLLLYRLQYLDDGAVSATFAISKFTPSFHPANRTERSSGLHRCRRRSEW